MNRFDYLDRIPLVSEYALVYANSQLFIAGIESEYANEASHTAHTRWWGFSFMHVRDHLLTAPIIRNKLYEQFTDWMHYDFIYDIVGDESPDVFSYHLEQNFPNPFNPSTRISFGLDKASHVTIRIYDTADRRVRTLVDEHRKPGNYNEQWDGKDGKGKPVASGIYFYRLTTGERTSTKKMVLLR